MERGKLDPTLDAGVTFRARIPSGPGIDHRAAPEDLRTGCTRFVYRSLPAAGELPLSFTLRGNALLYGLPAREFFGVLREMFHAAIQLLKYLGRHRNARRICLQLVPQFRYHQQLLRRSQLLNLGEPLQYHSDRITFDLPGATIFQVASGKSTPSCNALKLDIPPCSATLRVCRKR